MAEAQFIEMNAPSGRHARQVASLRQAIIKSIVEENAKEVEAANGVVTPAPEPKETTGDEDQTTSDGMDVINMMARSSVDLASVYKVARELFVLKGILKVDGDIQMTQTLLDNLTAQDFETLVGAYIANFTLPS